MKKYFSLILFKGLLLTSPQESTSAGEVNPTTLPDFAVRGRDSYDCQQIASPIRLCIDTKTVPAEAQEALRRAAVRLVGLTIADSSAKKCIQSVEAASSISFLTVFANAFQLKRFETEGQRGDIFVTGFRAAPIGTTKKLPIIFAYSKFFEAQGFSGNPYISVGFNQQILQDPSSGLPTNYEYLSALLAIGILKNMGIEESQIRPENDPVVRVAECILFDGQKPESYHLISHPMGDSK